jgi:Tol biopolymer transport system component
VAYAWFNAEGFYELRVVTAEAGKPAVSRTLHSNKEHAFVQPVAWSPDGKSILTLLFRGDNTSQIAMIDASLEWSAAARGEMKVLKSLAWIYPNRMDLSPDGMFIVYDNASEPGRPERDIYILATDGSSERKLIGGASNDVFPLWTPGGDVVFLRDGELMKQVVREGEASGEPRRLGVKLERALLLGITGAGALVYAQRTGSIDVYVADADFETGKLGEPRRASSSQQGGNQAPAWSAGGDALAYLTRIGAETFGQESRAISLYDVATGGQKVVTPRLALMESVAVSPDGGRLLIAGSDRHGASGLFTFDLQSGRTVPLVRGEGGAFHGNWMHEGRSVVFTPPGGEAIRALNLRTREASDILRAGPGERFRLPVPSPDGKWVAYARVRAERRDGKQKSGSATRQVETVEVGPLTGGEARTLITLRGGGARSVGWLPGSKDVIVTSPGRANEAKLGELVWRVSVDGGPARRLLEVPASGGVQVSPDGGKIAYTSGAVKTELWVMELANLP